MNANSSVGIAAYGVYIPSTRLPLALIHGGRAKEGGPQKAVAGFDEDTVTMATEAASNCLHGIDRAGISAVYFASTTSPFQEKQTAVLIAKALDLPRNLITMDFSGSLRAAAGALCAAIDAVKADVSKTILVIASDSRMAAPRSALERNVGDAAAAFLISANNPIAVLESECAIADEIQDIWKSEHDQYVRTWEDRFNIMHGYQKSLVAACSGLLTQLGRGIESFNKGVLYGPDARSLGGVVKAIGLGRENLQDPLFGQVGNCGVAFAPLLLIAALETAKSGDNLLVGFYGDGAHALSLQITNNISGFTAHHNVAWHLDRGKALRSYEGYLQSRHLEASEFDRRGGDGIPATIRYRERDTDISFIGQRCTVCGTMHFPACRVCYKCYAKDKFEDVRLSDLQGRVMSYSFDYFFPSPEPPLVVGMCEVEGGARVYVQMADATPDMLRCDLPVEFVFRKIHDAGNKPNYFWKSRPLTSAAKTGGESA